MKENILKRAIEISKDILKTVVREGDIVVDCTAGNGYDTVFLAKLIGEKGKVYTFDIQEKAIKNTERKLSETDLLDKVVLIHDGHENILSHVKENIKCAMFNLGYLPGGDHNITTSPKNVIKAIKGCLKLLSPKGIITIVCYTGHTGGKNELKELINYLVELDQRKYMVINYKILNQINSPPQMIAVEKQYQE
ncbi:MAG TPA: methyltransferase domain-containing protein [Thermoanaerobacterales bacterium]|nr:methyltransferase domain-containing protein [Thermoanaerobacterales bacterium]